MEVAHARCRLAEALLRLHEAAEAVGAAVEEGDGLQDIELPLFEASATSPRETATSSGEAADEADKGEESKARAAEEADKGEKSEVPDSLPDAMRPPSPPPRPKGLPACRGRLREQAAACVELERERVRVAGLPEGPARMEAWSAL